MGFTCPDVGGLTLTSWEGLIGCKAGIYLPHASEFTQQTLGKGTAESPDRTGLGRDPSCGSKNVAGLDAS